jgi:hypothetical protein
VIDIVRCARVNTEGSTVTNPAPGQPPAPGSAWPQQGAQQQPAPHPTAVLPVAQQHAPHEPPQHQQVPDDATIRLPRVPPAFPQAQQPPPPAFAQPPFPHGPQQAWPPQGPGFPPGVPGHPGPYGAAPASRKPTRILIGVVAAVVVLGVLVTGVVLTMRQVGGSVGTPAAPDVAASPLDGLAPDSASPGPGIADSEAVLAELSASLQSDLNDRDVEGLLQTVCEDGKTGDAARNDLMELPFLDPTSSQYADPINFPEGSVSLNDVEDDGSYLIDFVGSYTSTDEPISLTFKAYAYPDGSGAVWCGVA